MTFLDIFAGIGGFRLGLEQAGHKCVGHIEWDKYAQKSYMAMHDVIESEYIGYDIKSIRANELPRADCWCFGFPCQDISIAGKQSGFAGKRSSLFFTVTELIRNTKEENKPSYLFIENVKNLLSINGGVDFLKLLIELDEIGYDAEWDVLNSKYFGVPQNRERVFIIGHFRGRSTGKVFPIGQNDTVFDEQSRTDEGQSQAEYCTSLRASGSMKADSTYIKVIQVKQLFGTDNESNPSGGRVYSVKGIMRTLGSGHGMSQPYIEVKERLRRLTAKECFRLQGFPDEYFERAAAVNSDSQLYKQAGNSVTVNVIYEIAKKFKLGG